ncbi:MAG: 2-polyprenyl-6-methoxyphenol hydroxylase [Bacteroidetes bacterium B1(2017)]|nr:MAG: 2-polyprenyl-6-methoxyphenol hydroxylase [Bacteroidetes bacterium B1(2017)]
MKGKRIAIIGAGPGGIAAGIALSQAGFDVKIFEKSSVVTPLGGAIILNATGIVILRKWGVDVNDIFAAREPQFRRHDGHVRVKFELDKSLLDKAGVTGWQSGMMRAELYERMLKVLPEGMIETNHTYVNHVENDDIVQVNFANGETYETDLLIGSDGINSEVRQQLWGYSEAKHLGIAVWLGWCELDGSDRNNIIIMHDRKHQFGFAPLIYKGKNCYEWWFVEKCTETQEKPDDVMAYVKERVGHFADPIPKILAHTDPNHQLFRWVVKYREPLKKWSKGRATIMGDAAHPTSPYAAYGAGMSIEDAFFLAKFLKGKNLSDLNELQEGLQKYESERLTFTNKTTAFARFLGKFYHGLPQPLAYMRDKFLDNSSIPGKGISKGYTDEAQSVLKGILEE